MRWVDRIELEVILETERLVLRELVLEDAPFILELLNESSFLRFIGDKGVRNLDDARSYLEQGPIQMYERLGFGLYLTSLKEDGSSAGICGLIKRDSLDDVDVGFAFLPEFWGKGLAFESAAAVLAHGRDVLGLDRIVAIASQDNERSIRLLEKLGLVFEGMVPIVEGEPECRLFAVSG